MHKLLLYSKFIICLYMFRALCAHHNEVKIVSYSIWYHHTCRWPSGAQVERGDARSAKYKNFIALFINFKKIRHASSVFSFVFYTDN